MKAPDWIPESLRPSVIARRLDRGEMLFRREDRPLGLYAVESGEIRLIRSDTNGREITLFTARPGDTFAEASLFSAAYHCDAMATRPSIVHLFPKSEALAAFASEPAVAQALMATLARQVMTLRARLESRNLRTARERVLHHLEFQAGSGRTVNIDGSLKGMASELGLAHESLYRTLAVLETDGTIERAKGQIRLLAPRI